MNSRSVAESTAASENASVKTSELNSTSAAQGVAGSQSTSAANSALNSRSVTESTAASENTSANASESVNDSGLQSQSIVDSGNQSISGSTSITSEGSLSGSTPVADSVSSTNKSTYIKFRNAKTLPQTGEKKTTAGIFGLALAGIASLLGLAGDRKRKNN